jgi:hypothetical protein
MINYKEIARGDILRVVAQGAPGYAALGDLVRVVTCAVNSVTVENRDGVEAEFLYNCGAARLEKTEWTHDFPESKTSACETR